MKNILLKTVFIMIITNLLQGAIIEDKNSNDVYSIAEVLKLKIMHLAGEKNIKEKYLKVPIQKDKLPMHVMQKTIEVLTKINKYRKQNNLGEVNIPLYPSRDITSDDVYNSVVRLNEEIELLLKNIKCPHIAQLNSKTIKYINKTSNDNYRELWSASLAMDVLLGKGYTPTDNYQQSLLIIDIIKFLRNSQNIYEDVPMPIKKDRKHPNHVLYATKKLLKKIANVEKKLWMQPIEVTKSPERIITPTEVYDSTQIIITELKRIRKRLGIERFYDVQDIKGIKTPSDVLQNIEYAIKLFPPFDLQKELIQFDTKTLSKSVNQLYALSVFILEKVNYLKNFKGIRKEPKDIPKIYNLNEMHVYQKSIEAMEKVNILRTINGLYQTATPESPVKKKGSNSIYEILLMIDDELTIIMKQNGIKDIKRWTYLIEKKSYSDKTYSDLFYNMWQITSVIDTFKGASYTPNETYILAKRIEQRVVNIVKYLTKKDVEIIYETNENKLPSDVFVHSLELYKKIIKILNRANISGGAVQIPKEKEITPDSVYNALRVINASLIAINIHFGIDKKIDEVVLSKEMQPSDVYNVINSVDKVIQVILEDKSYEN